MAGYIEFNPLTCCGVGEIHGISEYPSPRAAMLDILSEEEERRNDDGEWEDTPVLYLPDEPIQIFTQAYRTNRKSGYGYALKDYIEANNLGTVVIGGSGRNPNSGNYVTVFVWTVNERGAKAWAKANGLWE